MSVFDKFKKKTPAIPKNLCEVIKPLEKNEIIMRTKRLSRLMIVNSAASRIFLRILNGRHSRARMTASHDRCLSFARSTSRR